MCYQQVPDKCGLSLKVFHLLYFAFFCSYTEVELINGNNTALDDIEIQLSIIFPLKPKVLVNSLFLRNMKFL